MKAVKCGQCDFWVQIGDTDVGHCKRYPPTVDTHLVPRQTKQVIGVRQQIGLEPIEIVTWPRTSEIEFCGEFQDDKS